MVLTYIPTYLSNLNETVLIHQFVYFSFIKIIIAVCKLRNVMGSGKKRQRNVLAEWVSKKIFTTDIALARTVCDA